MEIKSLFDLSGKAIPVTCNVLQDADLVNLLDTTVKTFGTVNILSTTQGLGAAVAKIPSRSMSAMSNASIASMSSLPCVCASSQYPKWANRATVAS